MGHPQLLDIQTWATRRESVKDVPEQCVKDVMELNKARPGAPSVVAYLDLGHPPMD